MLTTAEVAGIRQAVMDMLADTASVERVAVAQDGMGGATNTWSVIGTYPCRVLGMRPLPMGEQIVGKEKIVERTLMYIWLPASADVTPADRISVTTTETGAVVSYEVSDVQINETETPGVLALCDRIV